MNTHNLDSKRDVLIQKQAGKTGLRGKLNAYCISCTYDEKAPGNWRKQVGICLVSDCPLYPVRPRSETQQVKAALDKEKARREPSLKITSIDDISNGVSGPARNQEGGSRCVQLL